MNIPKNKILIVSYLLFYMLFCEVILYAEISPVINGIYLPPTQFSKRSLIEFNHYAEHTGMNAVVLHMKDPFGHLYWTSQNPIAIKIGAVSDTYNLAQTLAYLKSKKIRTIAKVDVFIDKKLAENIAGYGIINSKTGELWTNFSGLNWTNPYDPRVWDYNIALCRELAKAGFDEIQFDYIRFPSDGPLSLLDYPVKPDGVTMAKSIGGFLARAYGELKPLGVDISADVFGLTAWKKNDFGVGQVIEEISPYVDIICPMFYPSHFPDGFMGFRKPADHPGTIMYRSIKALKKRTDRKIRPWIQGFWYPPNKIRQQLNAVRRAGFCGWMVWNSAGNYETTYLALAKDLSDIIPPPLFYQPLNELRKREPRIVKGDKIVVNYTNYQTGISVLSLERTSKNSKNHYSTPVSVVYSMDEAILDLILIKNRIQYGRKTDKYVKSLLVAELLCRHIGRSPNRIKPQPVYIDWSGNSVFSLTLPTGFNLNGSYSPY